MDYPFAVRAEADLGSCDLRHTDERRIGLSGHTVTAVKPADIRQYIVDNFPGTDVIDADGDAYFVHDPDRDLPDARRQPWATLVTSDAHDSASDLDRPEIFRLNVGLTKAAFRELFPAEGDHDLTSLDIVMPHPVYASLYWVCVLNPGNTWPAVRGLLQHAYAFAVRKHANAAARRSG